MTAIDLSETQRHILTAACQRRGGLVLPAASSVKGGALKKVLGSLLARGLIKEGPASASHEVWRKTEDGTALTLKMTRAGYQAVGIERGAGRAKAADPGARPERAGTKQAQVIALLQRPDGATIEQIVVATGWQAHTVRGAIAGSLKKRLGLAVTSEKMEGRGRVYRVPS